jgi:hypothetical protein
MTALQVHDWIYQHLQLPEEEVRMIQIDGPGRRVFIKFQNDEQAQNTLQATSGQMTYQHENGESYNVFIEHAGMGTKRIRIANLPPEVPNSIIRDALATYGDVLEIIEESWSKAYRYSVSNGIRVAVTRLKKSVPSNMTIGGTRVIITYENQPPTCYVCNTMGHQSQECPKRKLPNKQQNFLTNPTRADVVEQKIARPPIDPIKNNPFTINKGKDGTTTITMPNESHNVQANRNNNAAQDTLKQDGTHTADNIKTYTATSQITRPQKNNKAVNIQHEQSTAKDSADQEEHTTHNRIETNTESTIRELEDDTKADGGNDNKIKDNANHSPMDDEPTKVTEKTSPKRNKKLKTEREPQHNTDRTRSRSRGLRMTISDN